MLSRDATLMALVARIFAACASGTRADTGTTNPGQRLCWHTSSGTLSSGYRCGAMLNAGSTYERLVYEAD